MKKLSKLMVAAIVISLAVVLAVGCGAEEKDKDKNTEPQSMNAAEWNKAVDDTLAKVEAGEIFVTENDFSLYDSASSNEYSGKPAIKKLLAKYKITKNKFDEWIAFDAAALSLDKLYSLKESAFAEFNAAHETETATSGDFIDTSMDGKWMMTFGFFDGLLSRINTTYTPNDDAATGWRQDLRISIHTN